jgi:adenine deaminase
MKTVDDLEHLIDAGLGRVELDLAVVGGRLLDVYRGEWVDGDVGVAGGRIVSFGENDTTGRQVIDARGKFVVPGFFDAHFHAGGSNLAPSRMAEAMLPRGTTSTVCDFQEHYVVAGVPGARFALDEARAAGLRVLYLVPIHMFVINDLGVAGRRMRVEDMLEMLEWSETVAINEPPPGPVLAKDPQALQVIARTHELGKVYAGHAPGFSGRTLHAYIATGASSDHESTEAADAWSKLAGGMRVFMRQGSAAPDMERLIELAVEHPAATRHMMLVSDEVDPVDLASQGHMDYKVKLAIARGVDVVTAYQMASLNGAEYYRVDHDIGSLAPGRSADMVILNDPVSVEIDAVIAQGTLVGSTPRPSVQYPPDLVSRVRLSRPLTGDDFRVPFEGDVARVRVLGVSDGSLLSEAQVAEIPTTRGSVPTDPQRDLLKVAVIDTHSGSGDIAVGFLGGFGLSEGAVATTYAHPYYNVCVVGADEASMALAVNSLAELGGGVVAVSNSAVARQWRLDIVGVFSTAPLKQVLSDMMGINETLHEMGCRMKSPVLALSFIPVPTIPDYGLTTKGLYDVHQGKFISLFVDS